MTARQRSSRANYASIGDAGRHITELMFAQVERSVDEHAPTNVKAPGDTSVRHLFYMLLPAPEQRKVFIAVMADRRAWPRARSLFGAPPFAFLRPQDGSMLRAAGIAAGRKNMAYEGDHVLNYSQFGAPHLVDAFGRQFRVMQDTDGPEAPIAVLALHAGASSHIVLIARLKKRRLAVRRAMLRTAEGKRALSFPSVGETLRLRPTETIGRVLALEGTEESRPIDLCVKMVRVVSDHMTSTAMLTAKRY